MWSVSTKQADLLLKLSETEFANRVMAAGGNILGEFNLLSPLAAFPLNLQTTHQFVRDCVVLVGDAAHQIHPMAGQGANLGFRDVVDLIEIYKEKINIGR